MKKIIFAAAALFAFGFANAQDTKEESAGGGFANGDVFISGAVGFSSDTFGDDKDNTFTIAPKVGFFVADNIAIGAQVAYVGSTSETAGIEEKQNTFGVGGFARYYWTPQSQFSFFAELGVDYLTQKEEVEGTETGKRNGFGINVAPGVSYFISDNFALEASIGVLGYNSLKEDGADESANSFDLGLNTMDLSIGLIYKF